LETAEAIERGLTEKAEEFRDSAGEIYQKI
jgi:hypothetical protein